MNPEAKHIVLSTDNLTIGYRNRKKLHVIAADMNIKLYQGELVALVGPNGIGKSTLLRTLSKVQPALSGDIFLCNIDLQHYSFAELATQLSVVFTDRLASQNLTVQEIVALGRQPYTNWIGTLSDLDYAAVSKALEITHTTPLAHRYCYELSDGQLQKVLIARAIAQDTPVIILDEPTTHLDIYHKAYILTLLKRLAAETQKTILFSIHDIDLAIQLCDKMMVMNAEGFEYGRPKELIQCRSFSSLFPEDLIYFDLKSGSYKIKA